MAAGRCMSRAEEASPPFFGPIRRSSNFSGSGRKTVVTPLRLVTYNARLPSRKTVETVGTNWNLTPGQKPSVNEILHVSFRYPRPEGGSTAFSFSHSPSHPDDHHGQKA